MKCVVKCADDKHIPVPACCFEYMYYFKSLRAACSENDFFKIEEIQEGCEEANQTMNSTHSVPIKTFQYNDKETGKSLKLRFTCSSNNPN